MSWKAAGVTYNRYLAIAARAVRNSLKPEAQALAERRGAMELRVARWNNGKAAEAVPLAEANRAPIEGASN